MTEASLERCALILLAGGKSERMGTLKGLLPVPGGVPFLEWQLRRFAAAGGKRAVVVLGWRADDYLAALPLLRERTPFAGLSDVVVARNVAPARGSFSSLVVGCQAALNAWPRSPLFVLPIDVPAPAVTVWQRLANAALPDGGAATPSTPSGRGGHPVLLDHRFAEGLIRLQLAEPQGGDAHRLDVQLRNLAPVLRVSVPVEGLGVGSEAYDPQNTEAAQRNLNTPADWAAWTAQLRD